MRPRQFDEEKVLELAFDQFWKQGVKGTSLADIAREAGVQRGSLYNAYGSKEALFLRAYESYRSNYLDSIQEALSKGSLRQRLEIFFDVTIANFSAGEPSRGCPTTKGLMELSAGTGHGLPDEARHAFSKLLDSLLSLLQQTFDQAVEKGEFHGDPQASAEQVLTIARGLVVLERAYSDNEQLHRIARKTVDFVLGDQP